MLDYIVCFVFWTALIICLHIIGRAATRGIKSNSYSFVVGYLIYSFPIAIAGVFVQIANIPWWIFAVFVGLLWCALLGWSVFKMKKEKITAFSMNIKQYIQSNWIMLGICATLIGILFFNFAGFWLDNHLDDGYYVVKAATLPYMGYGDNYSVGVPHTSLDSYILNTWELEASVYVKVLGVKVTLFLRLFQSAFYYFLFLNVVCALFERIIEAAGLKVGKMASQYGALVVLVFGMYNIFLTNTKLFALRDMFHFNSGMYLGSSVVKMIGIAILILFYFDRQKISLKMVCGVFAIAVVLISKSTIALPVIIIGSAAYLCTILIYEYNKAGKIVGGMLLTAFCIISVFLSNKQEIQDLIQLDVVNSLKSPVVWGAAITFSLSFTFKNKVLNKINTFMIIMAAFMAVPNINNIFKICSVYNFVAGRAWTTYIYFFTLTGSMYFYLLLEIKYHVHERIIKKGYQILTVCLFMVMGCGFWLFGGAVIPNTGHVTTNFIHCISVYVHNPYFMPSSTIQLSESLEELSRETDKQLRVISPEWVYPDGALHGLPVMLRTYAPDIVSVSAANRFGAGADLSLEGYSQEWYDAFVENPCDETLKIFESESQKVDANCVVTQAGDSGKWLEKIGYQYFAFIDNIYYIWYK